MRRYLLIIIVSLSVVTCNAQSPLQLNYQAVVRDNTGQPVANNTPVALTFVIHNSTSTGTSVYNEIISATTNEFGLLNVQIGSTADLSAVNWKTGGKLFLQVEASINGGATTDMGTTQLLSVPYALYAETSGNAGITGPTGPNGITGNNGPTGPTGSTGIPGSNGNTGPTGPFGTTGATGSVGSVGAAGAAGAKGATGPSGPTGATGPLGGPAGPTGPTGVITGAWTLVGNTGTVDGTDFLGTKDSVAFTIKVNNQPSGRIDPDFNSGSTSYGYKSLLKNVSASAIANSAFGYGSLQSNTGLSENSAFGFRTLMADSDGAFNTAVGAYALQDNEASYNTALGDAALGFNTTGASNTATGQAALASNNKGGNNTANGYNALDNNTTGIENTSVGSLSLTSNKTGSTNTALGYAANVSTDGFANSTAIGANAVSNATNKLRLGATGTIIEGATAYTPSDGRFKDNVQQDVPGLKFIMQLRPVTYQFNGMRFEEHIRQQMANKEVPAELVTQLESQYLQRTTGFIAQEVENAAKIAGYNGFQQAVYKPTNATDNYSLNYQQFVVPLVKAVQELNGLNDTLQQKVGNQELRITQLESENALLKSVVNNADIYNTKITELEIQIATLKKWMDGTVKDNKVTKHN